MAHTDDPTTLTSATFSRKAFVGISAGAAGVASTIAAALAEGAGFGMPHPPIVAENDPTIATAHVMLTRPDTAIDAYAAWPKTITATTPAVVVVQHIWGVDAQIRDTVRRYAKEGFIAIAPDLFARSHPPSGDGTSDISLFVPAARALQDDVVAGDLLAGRDWIHTKAARANVGITGFCMGGGIVLKQVIARTDYATASMFYGGVHPGGDTEFMYADMITVPLMGSFGARDTSKDIQPADVEKLFSLLKAPHDVKIYAEAGHAFFDDTRKAYVASAAADAWTRTLRWFRTYLA
jgi:carboxymethylenebutenolidase